MLLLALLACRTESTAVEEAPVVEEAPPPALTAVRLNVVTVASPFRWDAEVRGLLTAALEAGLYDLPGVVPILQTAGPALSVMLQRPAWRREVDGRATITGNDEALTLELELCVAGAGCESHLGQGSRVAPWEAVGAVLDGAATQLGVEVDPQTRLSWRTPGSKDTYAELITGRAAALYYGILPAEETGSTMKRAVNIDPAQPLAQWLLARWEMGFDSDPTRAVDILARAALRRPTSPIFLADEAFLLGKMGKKDAAMLAWESLTQRFPRDPRFLEPYARSLAANGREGDAREVLQALPQEFLWDPSVAALQVEVAEVLDGDDALDPLLEHWQKTDISSPLPVRRRIDLRVARGDYSGALLLVEPLRARQPGEVTDALEMALLVAEGRLEEAAARAPQDVATRIHARSAWTVDPGAEPVTGGDAGGLIGEASAALWRGEAENALSLAETFISRFPGRADGHLVRARALESEGRAGEAAAAWGEVWLRDPSRAGGPVGERRVVGSLRVVTE